MRGRIENDNHVIGQNGQSDMMFLINFDIDTEKAILITIPRETMTTIDISAKYMPLEAEKKTEEAQICLQYGYATSSQMGAELATQCVENLLNISIDYYVAISMGG